MRWKARRIKKNYFRFHRRNVRHIKRLSRKPFLTVPIFTLLAFAVVGVGIFGLVTYVNGGTPQLKPIINSVVLLNYEGKERDIPTRDKTVGDLLKNLGIVLNPGDVVEPNQATPIIGDDFRVNIYKGVPVTIVDGSNKIFTNTADSTPRSIAQYAGVTVYPEDYLTLVPAQNFLTDYAIGEEVVINRATPVNVNLYGTPVVIRTHAKTVADLLKEQKITLSQDNVVQPDPSTPLTASTEVFLIHKGTQIQTVSQSIPAPTQIIPDDSLTFGVSVVQQQGAPGQEEITYEINTQNGQEVSRQVIQTVVTQAPVTEIVHQGTYYNISSDKTSIMTEAGIASSDFPYVDYIMTHESGWCPTKRQGEVGYCPATFEALYSTSAEIGYGLGQATPADQMASYGSDWETDPITQLKWATAYADRRYGGWSGAYDHWIAYGNW